jgi:hypothetical protein
MCYFVCTVLVARQCFVIDGITIMQSRFLAVQEEGLLVKVCQHSEQKVTDFLLLAFDLDHFYQFLYSHYILLKSSFCVSKHPMKSETSRIL